MKEPKDIKVRVSHMGKAKRRFVIVTTLPILVVAWVPYTLWEAALAYGRAIGGLVRSARLRW